MILKNTSYNFQIESIQEYFAQKRREAKERRKSKFPPPIPIIELRDRPERRLDEGVYVQELEDISADETHQTNVTDFGEEGVPGLQIKPLATSSSKRPPRERPTVTFGETEIM